MALCIQRRVAAQAVLGLCAGWRDRAAPRDVFMPKWVRSCRNAVSIRLRATKSCVGRLIGEDLAVQPRRKSATRRRLNVNACGQALTDAAAHSKRSASLCVLGSGADRAIHMLDSRIDMNGSAVHEMDAFYGTVRSTCSCRSHDLRTEEITSMAEVEI